MRLAPTRLLSAGILALLAAACGAVVEGQPTPRPSISTPTPAVSLPAIPPVATPGSESSSTNAEAQAAVAAALRDAADRLSLAPGDIQVHQVEPRQWPDSSLGCPRPGVMYSQIVTPGYRIVVSAAAKQLEYHADSRGRIVFCQEL